MRRNPFLLAVPLVMACSPAPPARPPQPDQSAAAKAPTQPVKQGAQEFINAQVEALKPLYRAAGATWFEASTSGSDEDFAKSREAENAVNRFYADPARFAAVQRYRADESITDPLVKRQLEVLYLGMLGKQVVPDLLEQITAIGNKVEQEFNTYRGQIGGEEVSQNKIVEILRTSKDSAKLKAAWEAQKGVGSKVADQLKELVGLRNQVAKKLGFRDFYALRLAENEQSEDDLLALFDELDELTRDAFAKHKAEVDRRLSKRLKIPVTKLMPWHYQNPFFQEPPDVFATGLDEAYRKGDTLALCRSFYQGIGIDVEDIIERSDLYEKKGKSPHAFCANIDREGDIRVLANIDPGQQWQSTMIHELGHAVYEKYVDPALPWLLRGASHSLTTEGVAMMLDRLVGNPYWAASLGVIDDAKRDAILPEAKAFLAFAPLQFSRWAQVMLRFERAMYGDPDQDLDKLWWDLVERYQMLHRPPDRHQPDYASKIHLVVAPVYYHNYMMGDLFAAQVHEALAKIEGKSPFEAVLVGDPKVGEFLKSKLFGPGERLRWDELTKELTGSELSAQAYARRFKD